MAGRHFRNRSITFVEDCVSDRGSNEVDEFSGIGNTAVNQEAETEGTVMSECVGNNFDSIVKTETSVGMTTRQLQDLLNDVITTWRTDIVTMSESKFQDIVTTTETNSKFEAECSNIRSSFLTITYSKLQAATENITAKIQQENEKLMQKLHIEVKKLSSDMRTLQNDAENKFQEVTRTIGGVNDAMNERIDADVVATRKMTDRISQEMNARSGSLRNDMKEYRSIV
jgi:hypothetical protein